MMSALSRITMGYFSDILGRNTIMSIPSMPQGAYIILPYVNSLAIAAILPAIIVFSFVMCGPFYHPRISES